VPSRQDQLHSYQYSLQRVVAALVTHEPDPHRSPLRRAGTTALVSLVIAALAVGGAAVYGLLTGHSNVTLQDESAVFLEKGTGARYVFLKSDGKLHPVLNYTSGLLVASGSAPNVVSVSRERLATVPLGDPLGIPDAPDSLPAAKSLLRDRWSVCSAAPDPGSAAAGPRSTLLVGHRITDGTVAAAPGPGRAPVAVLVSDPAERIFLVYANRRFLVPPAKAVATLRALGWADRQPWPVAAAWINSVPLGPDLAAPPVPEQGSASSLRDWRVGQLLTDGRQWGVVLADGFAPITRVQALLLQTDPDAYRPQDVGSAFNTLPASEQQLVDDAGGLPSTVPELAAPTSRVCMTLPVDAAGDGVRIDPTVPAGVPVTGEAAVPGGVQADLVHVARGKGALVAAAASATAPPTSGTVSIVTDTGRRYPIASRDLLGRLGYGGTAPVQVPAQLVALLPQGPALDAAQARRSAGRTAER
jgi:type VII secretion protein EccB